MKLDKINDSYSGVRERLGVKEMEQIFLSLVKARWNDLSREKLRAILNKDYAKRVGHSDWFVDYEKSVDRYPIPQNSPFLFGVGVVEHEVYLSSQALIDYSKFKSMYDLRGVVESFVYTEKKKRQTNAFTLKGYAKKKFQKICDPFIRMFDVYPGWRTEYDITFYLHYRTGVIDSINFEFRYYSGKKISEYPLLPERVYSDKAIEAISE